MGKYSLKIAIFLTKKYFRTVDLFDTPMNGVYLTFINTLGEKRLFDTL